MKRNTRILYVTGSLRTGGSELQLYKLLKHLPREITPFIAYYDGGDLENKYRALGIQMHKLRITSNYYRVAMEFAAIVDLVAPNIIQAQLPFPNYLAAIIGRIKRIPVIINERGMATGLNCRDRLIRRITYPLATMAICNSEAIKIELIEKDHIKGQKVTIIRNITENMNTTKRIDPKMYGVTSSNIRILTSIASLKAIKGIEFLLCAIPVIQQKFSCHLLIAGSGPKKKYYENLAEKLEISESVSFLGLRKDIPELLSISDVLVSSSISEGTSNSILEAMFAGVPVVATAVDGTRFLLENLKTGILVDSKSSESLAEGVCLLFENNALGENIRKSALAKVLSLHSPDIVIAQYMELYSKIFSPATVLKKGIK